MKRAACILLTVLFALTPLSVCAEEINKEQEDTFTLLWTTDTQWYSFAYPEILSHQNDWVVENYERLGIEYIFHTGDFVDLPHEASQWEVATKEYAKWDEAKIPYGVLAGNHDVDGEDHSAFSSYFGKSRYDRNPWYGGDFQDNKGHYDLMTLGGVEFLFLYMGYGTPTEEGISWMNGVLEQYADRIAFLMFHEFLDAEGNRTAVGNTYFEKVVLPNPNVRMVLCGHNYNSARREESIDDDGDAVPDRTVYQIIGNYQDTPKGGNGYMRFMECDVEAGTISCRTYSPYLKDFNYFDNSAGDMDLYGYRDEFTLPFDFSAPKAASGTGTVVEAPRAALRDPESGARELFSIDVCNRTVEDPAFSGVGLYDAAFALQTKDISPLENVLYVIAEYHRQNGYTVTEVTRENKVIPEQSVVLAFFGMENSFAEAGQKVVFSRDVTEVSPLPQTMIQLYVYDCEAVFGIDAVGTDSARFAIYDRTHRETVTAGQRDALLVFAPLAEHTGVYTLTQALTVWGETKKAALSEGGFALRISLADKSESYRQSLEEIFFPGASVALNGYIPEEGITKAGDSILSFDPADWKYDASVMMVEEQEGALVLSNNNGLWPDGTYTLPEPITFDPNTAALYYDLTVQNGGKTSILLLIGGQYVKLNSFFAGATISQNSGDVKGDGKPLTGSFSFASLPIPESCYNDDGTVTLRGVQIYACGTAGLTTTYRDLRVITDTEKPLWPDYTPAPREEDPDISEEPALSQPEKAESSVGAPSESSGGLLLYLLLGVGGVIAAAAALILVLRKKK
ncbi:MAG: hypothetical protein E7651_01260 [Ruminococcaceae bacterium]|nr:hypothetical protein [Oscillospiraceae bacterium]